MKLLVIVGLTIMALAGCGHKPIDYSPAPPPGMTREQAVETVEQVFYEDFSKTKPQSVVVTEKFIWLSQGLVSKGTTVATADVIGNSAIGLGTSTVATREVGQRIYFNSIGKIGVFQRKMKSGQFAVVVRATDGSELRAVRMRSLEKAQRFADALEYLRAHSS
ncbi:hypothetical protein [Pseudomonas sp. I2]|uniref:hypothetical protein n=1 Tax=Pseudomonas sp. I2 TaxID=1338438 RepID=UPI0034D3E52C